VRSNIAPSSYHSGRLGSQEQQQADHPTVSTPVFVREAAKVTSKTVTETSHSKVQVDEDVNLGTPRYNNQLVNFSDVASQPLNSMAYLHDRNGRERNQSTIRSKTTRDVMITQAIKAYKMRIKERWPYRKLYVILVLIRSLKLRVTIPRLRVRWPSLARPSLTRPK
jgi:hypothetical protein